MTATISQERSHGHASDHSDEPRRPHARPSLISRDLERTILGACLLSSDAIEDATAIIDGLDFAFPEHSAVFNTIVALYQTGHLADPLTVEAALHADHPQYAGTITRASLMQLTAEVHASANMPAYASQLADLADRRRLIDAAAEVAESATNTGRDLDQIRDTLANRLERLARPTSAVIHPNFEEWRSTVTMGYDWVVPDVFERRDRAIVVAAEGGGKALAIDTALPTPTGMTTMGEIRPGDMLLGPDEKPTRVLAVSGIMHDRPCYRITFEDDTQIVADAGHLWPIVDGDYQTMTLTTEQLAGRDLTWISTVPTYRNRMRMFTRIEPCDSVPVQCVMVDHPYSIFLAGETGIPTHNSTLLRQWALMAASGIHWFRHERIPPCKTLIVDVENSGRQIVRNSQRMYDEALRLTNGDFDRDNFVIAPIGSAIDLTTRTDRMRVEQYLNGHRPDLLVIGPLYKLARLVRQGSSYEEQATHLTEVLDTWRDRYGCALLIEHHAAKGSGGQRSMDPLGSSMFLRWPEFVLTLEPIEGSSNVKLGHARGQREYRSWPDAMQRGVSGWMWKPVDDGDQKF